MAGIRAAAAGLNIASSSPRASDSRLLDPSCAGRPLGAWPVYRPILAGAARLLLPASGHRSGRKSQPHENHRGEMMSLELAVRHRQPAPPSMPRFCASATCEAASDNRILGLLKHEYKNGRMAA